MSELDPKIQEQINDIVSTYPNEVATALRGLPICEVCSVNIPGRPGDPDGLCKLHAEVDEEFNR